MRRLLCACALFGSPFLRATGQARGYEYAEFQSYFEYAKGGRGAAGAYLDTQRGREFFCREIDADSTRITDYDRLSTRCAAKMQIDLNVTAAKRLTALVSFDPLYLSILGRLGWEVYQVQDTKIELGTANYTSGHIYYLKRAAR